MLFLLNDQIICNLIKLNISHYSIARNYSGSHKNSISSIHFFTSNKPDENNCYLECAFFMPDMHSSSLGKLSGFNEVQRLNGVDIVLDEYFGLHDYISNAVVLKSRNGDEALYINGIYINDDKDLQNLKGENFWNKVKTKYKIEKPQKIFFSENDQKTFDLSSKFENLINNYIDFKNYFKISKTTL